MIRMAMKWVLAGVLSLLAAGGALAQGKGGASPQTVKIAFMDPLSGPFAAVGQAILKHFQYVAELVNEKQLAGPGVKFEIVPFDNKGSPQESLTLLRSIIDQNIHYVTQGNGSHVAIPLSDAIAKHNERNPGQAIVYLNYAAVDPDLTNSKCNFWHFRFDANTDMKMEALTEYMKGRPEIKSVYLINQNYSHGHQVARYAKEMLQRKRPDVQVVGEDLHPLAQVRDFTPYVAKIKASGADTVITGNWGSDLSLLVRAANEAGLNVRFFTYYAGVTGTPTALGTQAEGRVYQVGYNHYNMGGQMDKWMAEFKQRFNDDFYTGSVVNIYKGLAQAMANAKSTDPVKVAHALSGLKFQGFNGEVEMRRLDHQLQQPLYLTRWQKTDAKHPYSPENTGMTLVPVREFPAYVASTPTSCQMRRPG